MFCEKKNPKGFAPCKPICAFKNEILIRWPSQRVISLERFCCTYFFGVNKSDFSFTISKIVKKKFSIQIEEIMNNHLPWRNFFVCAKSPALCAILRRSGCRWLLSFCPATADVPAGSSCWPVGRRPPPQWCSGQKPSAGFFESKNKSVKRLK